MEGPSLMRMGGGALRNRKGVIVGGGGGAAARPYDDVESWRNAPDSPLGSDDTFPNSPSGESGWGHGNNRVGFGFGSRLLPRVSSGRLPPNNHNNQQRTIDEVDAGGVSMRWSISKLFVARFENFVPYIILGVALFTRFYRLAEPAGVCFDESHFIRFTNQYTARTYFFDIHPPLGKLTLWAMGQLVGLNSPNPSTRPFMSLPTDCNYEHISEDYAQGCKYVYLRAVAAFHSSLTVLLLYLITRGWGASVWGGIAASGFLLFDMLNNIQGRLVLLDVQLSFWTMAALYVAQRWWRRLEENWVAEEIEQAKEAHEEYVHRLHEEYDAEVEILTAEAIAAAAANACSLSSAANSEIGSDVDGTVAGGGNRGDFDSSSSAAMTPVMGVSDDEDDATGSFTGTRTPLRSRRPGNGGGNGGERERDRGGFGSITASASGSSLAASASSSSTPMAAAAAFSSKGSSSSFKNINNALPLVTSPRPPLHPRTPLAVNTAVALLSASTPMAPPPPPAQPPAQPPAISFPPFIPPPFPPPPAQTCAIMGPQGEAVLTPRALTWHERNLWCVLMGFVCANAFSVKMTGLVTPFLIAIESFCAIWFLRRGAPFIDLFKILIIASLTYALWFALHFAILTRHGDGDEEFTTERFQSTLLESKLYDPKATWEGFWWTFYSLNRRMIVHNANILAPHPWMSSWYEWVFNIRGVSYYGKDGLHSYTSSVYLIGNHALHYAVLAGMGGFAVAVGAYLRLRPLWTPSLYKATILTSVDGEDGLTTTTTQLTTFYNADLSQLRSYLAQSSFCLLGYWLNLLPYLGVARSTFIYHYMPALLYGELILARTVEHFAGRKHAATAVKISLAIIGAVWLHYSPWIYGYALTNDGHARRRWNPRWD